MYGGDRDNETICAVSTPPGRGGVAVIRISGPRALEIGRLFLSFVPVAPDSHRIYFGTLKNPDTSVLIDEVLVSFFAQGKSYTGDETLEISCHGNPSITNEVLKLLVEKGASLAGPGEFTYRAFINGKIDLVQAENVLALIEGATDKQRRVALRNLKGDLSKEVLKIEDDLIYVLAQLEASIDFIEEDIEVYSIEDLQSRLNSALEGMRILRKSYDSGKLITEGIDIAIIGPPNAGKSSLLNKLSEEDRAIVTEVPGTTRDIVTSEIQLDGIKVRFLDTAGIRETEDLVESLGIERSKKAASNSDFVFFVFDLRTPPGDEELAELLALSVTTPMYVVGNKADLLSESDLKSYWEKHPKLVQLSSTSPLLGSVQLGNLKDQLLEEISSSFREHLDVDASMITSNRQYEAVSRAERELKAGMEAVLAHESPDLISARLKDCLYAIQEVLGKQFDDQILDRIFNEFCIGK